MSQDELNTLEAQEKELEQKLQELKNRKLELEKRLKEEEVTIGTATLVTEGAVICVFNPRKREDILKLLMRTPGRWFNHSTNENTIPVEQWHQFVEEYNKLEKVQLVYKDGVKEKIDLLLKMPRWEVEMGPNRKYLVVKAGYKVSTYPLNRVPNTVYHSTTGTYRVQLAEGYKLWEQLSKEDRVEWSDEAKELVLSDIAKREKLDVIALKTESPEIGTKVAELLKNGYKLKPFQEVGVEFADASGGSVINGDQMGLGKTIQFIAYCMYLDKYVLEGKGRFAVICPASVRINWRREIEKFTGEIAATFSGETPGVRDLERIVINKTNKWNIFNYDILARKKEQFTEVKDSSGNVFRQNIVDRYLWVDLINSGAFDAVAADEAHYIKNTNSQRSIAVRMLKVPRLYFMTGTPILNRPGELWPMLTMLAPELFPSEEQFLSRYTIGGKLAKNVDELRSLIKPFILRRRKKDVMKDLPPIERITDYHDMSAKARKLYDKALKGVYHALDQYDENSPDRGMAIPNILAQIMRLKQICSYDKMDRAAELATELYDTHDENGQEKSGEAKKVIIFTQFKTVAYGIAKRLGGESVVLTGDAGDEGTRQKIVDEFQNNDKVHFLVGTWQVMGEGRNLTAAGYVIFADLFWTPANHQQCEERCYGRVGDMHGATAYYLVVENTVEDWIQEILARKLSVIEQVVEGYDVDRNQSIAGELLKRMKEEMYKSRKEK